MRLLHLPGKDGKGGRSCDGRCHDAKGDKCTCVCEGLLHGIGLTRARNITREMCRDGEGVKGIRYSYLTYQGVLKFPETG